MMSDSLVGSKVSRAKILVVEDDHEMRRLLADELADEGYEVSEAENGDEAALKCVSEKFNLVITDMVMPKMGGLDLLTRIKDVQPETPVILITAFGDQASLMEALQKGALNYICKPFKTKDLKEVVRKAIAG